MYTTTLSTLISSLSLNRHLYADVTQLFFSFHPCNFGLSIAHLQTVLHAILVLSLMTILPSLIRSHFLGPVVHISVKFTLL